ncbi:Uncharacterised protein [Mycobacterium tuberculosis]|nr:Uncharacterised protein [Mycobacterium tuberculosis]
MPSDGHGLGQRGYLGRQPVRDRKRQRLLDDEPLGVGARRHCRKPDPVHLFVATPQQRHGDDRGAAPRGPAGAGTVIDHLATELVSEHHLLIRSHEGVVARFGHHVGQFITVQAGMQVRSADTAPQHIEQQLTLGRRRGRPVDYLELCVGAGHRLHRVGPLDPTASGLNVRRGGAVTMDYVATAIVVTLVILLGVGIVVNELLRLKQWLKNSRPDAEPAEPPDGS